MSTLDTLYLSAHDYPGAIRALAARMLVNPSVLAHKLNPNDTTNHLTVRDMESIMTLTGDYRALHTLCMDHGHMALPLPAVVDQDASTAIIKTCEEFADYLKSVTVSLSDGKVTAIELRSIQKELSELVAQSGRLEAILAAMQAQGAQR
ncbi:MAG: phage regulatory CII family protein [Gallionella sp.]|jgi:hypothetical protein